MVQEEASAQSEGGKPPVSLPFCDSLNVPKGYPPVCSDYCLATVEGVGGGVRAVPLQIPS